MFHNYEKNNVLQKSDNQEKNQTTKQQISYLEFDYMENDEVVITIEHCSNCEDHQTHTQHINEIYKKIAKVVQRCILLRFPFIKVYLKPIDTEIINRRIGEQLRSTIIDKNYKEVRIGALEIQCAVKKEDKVTINTIHSKLNSGLWPSINTVLKKIVSLMPRMNLSCIVFDKEEGIRSQSDDNEENLLPSKYENIKVCLYSYRNHQIEELIHYANEELEAIINPKKRKILLSQIKGSQIEQTFRPESSYLPSISNNKTERNIQSRPFTGRSTYTNSVYTTNNIISSRILSANKLSTRPMSSSFGFNKKKNENLNEIIEDKEGIQNSKASFYISTYTKKNGQAIFYNLPYDSYFVEVCDNKTFLHCGNIVKFNKILDTASTNSNEIATLNKFIGLRHQTDAYVEIFIYHNTIPEEYNLQPISGSQVILRRCAENIIDNSFFDDTMNKLIAQENDVEGRHDIVTVPGKYLLEIVKNGYDVINIT